jgi:hypothetical protein
MGKWDGGVNDDVMTPEIRPRHFFGSFAAFITSSGSNAEIAALHMSHLQGSSFLRLNVFGF